MFEKINYWFRFVILYKNWLDLVINRIRKINSNIIILRNGYILKASTNSPLSIVTDEIFILNRYTPKFMKIKSGDLVVDIGAHIGDFSIFSSVNKASIVYAYEPDPISYNDFLKNIKNNNIYNIKPLNLAVTNKNGLLNFYTNKINGGNSLYKTELQSKLIKIKSIKLQDVFIYNKIDRIDFLKIDCEGSEGLIFKKISKKLLNKINKISLEYHNNVSELNDRQLIKIFKTNNFKTIHKKISKDFGYIYAWR